MVIYDTVKEVVEKKLYNGTHEELVSSYEKREPFAKFIGGVIVNQAQLDEVLVENEDGKNYTVGDKYHWFETYDGRLFLTFMKMIGEQSWTSVESDEFYELADKYGIENVFTKSEMEALFPVIEEVII